MTVAVLGATGKTGRYVVPALLDAGREVLALGRDRGRLTALDPRCRTAVVDLEVPRGLDVALAEAAIVVSLAHARFAETILGALPAACERVVLTGSVRLFSTLPDPAADAVRRAEAAFRASGRPGVMLHPSMIFGAPEERNVNRILDLIDGWPGLLPVVVPLPGGGRHRVQPVYYEDVVAAFVAAVLREEAPGDPIVVAGPAPLSYAAMVRTCAAACGRRAHILPLPMPLLAAVAALSPVSADELRRTAEDKSFDITDLTARLGVAPRPFADGLADVVARRRAGTLAGGGASGHSGR
jgi:nucleoside-diphosphate-sugar epimerase